MFINQYSMASDVEVSGGAKLPLTLGLGVAYRDKPYAGFGDSKKTQAVPIVMYEGEHFFARGNQIGWDFLNSEAWELAVIGEYQGGQSYNNSDSKKLTAMNDRDPSFMAGGHVRWRPEKFGIKLTALTDVSDESDGSQIRGELFYVHRAGDLAIRTFAQVAWQDSDLNDYYYGVRRREATATRAAYQADDDYNYVFGLSGVYQRKDSPWMFIGSLRYTVFGDEIDDSSITDDDEMLTGLIGIAYTFW